VQSLPCQPNFLAVLAHGHALFPNSIQRRNIILGFRKQLPSSNIYMSENLFLDAAKNGNSSKSY
jgi:hypothetical protein